MAPASKLYSCEREGGRRERKRERETAYRDLNDQSPTSSRFSNPPRQGRKSVLSPRSLPASGFRVSLYSFHCQLGRIMLARARKCPGHTHTRYPIIFKQSVCVCEWGRKYSSRRFSVNLGGRPRCYRFPGKKIFRTQQCV